jgi:hypothetical protein
MPQREGAWLSERQDGLGIAACCWFGLWSGDNGKEEQKLRLSQLFKVTGLPIGVGQLLRRISVALLQHAQSNGQCDSSQFYFCQFSIRNFQWRKHFIGRVYFYPANDKSDS